MGVHRRQPPCTSDLYSSHSFVSIRAFIMGFFGNLIKPAAPTTPPAPKAPQYPAVPSSLPKIKATKASDLTAHTQPGPEAQSVFTPHQTPSEYLNALQQKQQGPEMVKTLAHGMPDKDGVHWATLSADKVSDKLPPHEVSALNAAKTWTKNPTPENQQAASLAAAKGGCKGPGSMAAQGAAWSNPAPGAPRLAPHAVSGSVLMSSAINANPKVATPSMSAPTAQAPTAPSAPTLQAPQTPQIPQAPQAPAVVPPAVQAQTFQQQHPFIAMGVDIASGKTVA
jgi:hypothetical protein